MCSPSQPTQQQVASTELPEWAKPYAKDILAKGQALTDISQNPYQQYTQPRIAGFSPMQQQAMQGAAEMQPSQQVAQGSGLAYGAGLGGLGMAMGATPQNFQSQVGGYMNPYLQYALAPQLAEANRQYDISGTRQQSAATQAGAFGGSREAIMAAENERNRNMGLQNIIGQGYNQAYGRAQDQYNQAQQQALQGLGVGLQGASTLGQLGQTQYGQQMGINQLQAQYGGQQQALAQQGLTQSYQDFLNQQNYPYKQLGFMSDMIRGLPLGQQSTSQMYQAPPTALQTAGSLALTGYGINQLAKGAGGGQVYGYADGGSVTSEGNVQSIIEKLSPQQLQQAKQNALARRDMPTVEAIDARLAELASERSMSQGIAGAMPEQMADGIVQAAGGGILAFDVGGRTSEKSETDETSEEMPIYGPAPTELLARASRSADEILKFKPTQLTAEQRDEAIRRRFNLEKSLAGPDTATEEYLGMINRGDTDRAEMRNQGKGLAALAAAAGLVQGNSFARGLGQASGAFAQAYAPVIQADRKEKMALANMKFNLMDAQRKERMGMTKGALAAAAEAEKNQRDADKFASDKLVKKAEIDAKIAAAGRPVRTGGAGGTPKPFDILNAAEKAALANPDDPVAQRNLQAARSAAGAVYSGTAPAQVSATAAADKALAKVRYTKGFKDWAKSNYGGDMMEAEKAFIASQKAGTLPKIFSNLTAAPAAAPAPAAKPKDEKAKSTPSVLRFDAKGNPITD